MFLPAANANVIYNDLLNRVSNNSPKTSIDATKPVDDESDVNNQQIPKKPCPYRNGSALIEVQQSSQETALRTNEISTLTQEEMIKRFFEEFVCPLSQEDNSRFQEKMLSIVKRLNPDHDFENNPIEFVLDRRDIENAYHFRHEDRHIIGISKSLVRDESLLHWAIGHEYGHLKARVRGIEKNSKAEEAFADLHLINRIEELGLDATVAERFFTNDTSLSLKDLLLRSVSDVHPLSATRISYIEDALGLVSFMRGGLNINKADSISISDGHQDFVSFVDDVWQRTQSISMPNLNQRNAAILQNALSQILEHAKKTSDSELSLEERQDAIKQIALTMQSIEGIEINLFPQQARIISNALLEVLKDSLENYETLSNDWGTQKALFFIYKKTSELKEDLNSPMDILGLRALVKGFVEATDEQAIKKYASQIQEQLKHSRAFFAEVGYLSNADSFHIYSDQVRMNSHFKAPWEQHIQIDDESTKRTLVDLGVFDNRLMDHFGVLDYSHMIDDALCLSNVASDRDGRMIFGYRDENGEINYMEKKIIFNAFDEMPFQIIIQRTQELQSLLESLTSEIFASNTINEEQLQTLQWCRALCKTAKPLIEEGNIPVNLNELEYADSVIGLSQIEKNPNLFFEINPHFLEAEELPSTCLYAIAEKLKSLVESSDTESYKMVFTRLLDTLTVPLMKILVKSLLENPQVWTNQKQSLEILNELNIFSFEEHGNTTEKLLVQKKYCYEPEISFDNDSLPAIRELFALGDVENLEQLNERLVFIQSLSDAGHLKEDNFLAKWACSEICECLDLIEDDDEYTQSNVVSFVNLLPKQALENTRFHQHIEALMPEQDFSGLGLKERLIFLQTIFRENLLSNIGLEDQIISVGLNQIDQISDPRQRLSAVEGFYTTSAVEWSEKVNILNEKWVSAVMEITQGDEELVFEYAKKASKDFAPRDFRSLINLLADRTCSQEVQSNRLYGLVEDKYIAKATTRHNSLVGFFETVKHLASKDQQLRTALTDLLYENTLHNRDKLHKALVQVFRRNSDMSLSVQSVIYYDFDELIKKLDTETKRNRYFSLLHSNFWSSSNFERAGLLKQFMFPPHIDLNDRELHFWGEFKYVVSKLIDKSDPLFSQINNTLVDFCKILDHRERALFLSLIFSAAEKTKTVSGEGATGKRLATLFSMMGPAWIKLGQAIHSFDKTPEDIRTGMEMMKLDVDAPTRKELFAHINKTLPENLRSRIKYVGERLGSASYFYVYRVTLDDNKDYALAILKPNAKARSEYGFQQMIDLINQMKASGQDPAYLSFLEELVMQSKEMAAVETNNANQELQEEVAKTNNANLTMTVNGQNFEIDIARNIQIGEGFRLMELAQGMTYNEIDKSSDPQFFKNFALGYHTHELINILSGNFFDEDRHGGQLKIENNQATLFDFGATKVDKKPSDQELNFVGELLADAYSTISSSDDLTGVDISKQLSEKFIAAIESYKNSGNENTGYLTSIHKAWLALADFRRDFTKQDYEQMFIAVLKSSRMSPKVLDGILNKLKINKALFQMGLKVKKSSIKFS